MNKTKIHGRECKHYSVNINAVYTTRFICKETFILPIPPSVLVYARVSLLLLHAVCVQSHVLTVNLSIEIIHFVQASISVLIA